nr:MAG: capsid protein [Cressdnaviricota sp.]
MFFRRARTASRRVYPARRVAKSRRAPVRRALRRRPTHAFSRPIRKFKRGSRRTAGNGSNALVSRNTPVFKVPSKITTISQIAYPNTTISPTVEIIPLNPNFVQIGQCLDQVMWTQFCAAGAAQPPRWAFVSIDWLKIHISIRCQMVGIEAAALPVTALNTPGFEAWWYPNYDLDVGLATVALSSSKIAHAGKVVARPDKNGLFKRNIKWVNQVKGQKKMIPIPALGYPANAAFPYGVNQYLSGIAAAGGAGFTALSNNPFQIMSVFGHSPKNILRIPSFGVMVPGTYAGLTSINVNADCEFTVEGQFSMYESGTGIPSRMTF